MKVIVLDCTKCEEVSLTNAGKDVSFVLCELNGEIYFVIGDLQASHRWIVEAFLKFTGAASVIVHGGARLNRKDANIEITSNSGSYGLWNENILNQAERENLFELFKKVFKTEGLSFVIYYGRYAHKEPTVAILEKLSKEE